MQDYQFVNDRPVEETLPEEKTPPPKKRRRLTGEAFLALLQIGICVVLILLVWGCKAVGGRLYEGFVRGYAQVTRMKLDSNELFHRFEMGEAPAESEEDASENEAGFEPTGE